jgi:hypothetical protein
MKNLNSKEMATTTTSAFAICTAVATLTTLFLRLFIGGDIPHVLSDEYAYAAQAKALWDHQQPGAFVAQSGNWVYIFLQSISFAFPESFLTVSRILNALSVSAAGLVLFLTFRRSAGSILMGLITLIAVITFGGSYARLFMPEAMQFAITIFLVCAFYWFGTAPSFARALLLGVLLGVAGLIKIHMFFFAPCILAGIALLAFIHRWSWHEFVKMTAAFMVFFLVSTYTIRFSISGDTSMNLLGPFYGGLAKHNQASMSHMREYWFVFKRHLLTVFLAFPSVIAVSAIALMSLRRSASNLNVVRCTLAVVMLGILGMMLVTAVFTVSAAGTGPYESHDRIHGRYYEHYLVIAMIVGSVYASRFLSETNVRYRTVCLSLESLLSIAAFFSTRHFEWQNPNDFVSAFGLYWVPQARAAALGLGLLTIGVLLLQPKISSVAATAATVIMLVFPAWKYDSFLVNTPVSDTDRAAKIVSSETLHTKQKVEIISYQANAEIYRAAFLLLGQPSTMIVLPSKGDEKVTCNLIATSGASWHLVIYPSPLFHCETRSVYNVGQTAVYSTHTP